MRPPRRIPSLSLPLLALLAAAPALPAQQVPPTAEARMQALERGLVRALQVAGRPVGRFTIAERLATYRVPAVSVAVLHEGRIDWARAWGTADVASGREATSATLFQAASMSKSVAALGALRMVEAGELSLDADVNASLRTWKVPANTFTAARPVTLRGLVSHTAGTTVHGFPGYAPGVSVPTTAQVLDGGAPANTAAVRVDTLPGSTWRYSGGGYTVAQLLMTDVSGRPFAELMRERVLAPLGMHESTYEQPLPASLRERAATGYRANGSAVEGNYHTYPEMAAAGLWTTPSDYARFALALQRAYQGGSDPILSQAMARQMLTPVLGGYGLGVAVQGTGADLRFSHGGSNAGFRSTFVAWAGSGEGIVVMTNSDNGGALAQEILLAAAAAYGWSGHQPTIVTPIAVEPAALAGYTGTYQVPGALLVVTVQDGRLLVSEDGSAPVELVPTAPDAFLHMGRGMPLRFERDAQGAVEAIRAGNARAPRVAR